MDKVNRNSSSNEKGIFLKNLQHFLHQLYIERLHLGKALLNIYVILERAAKINHKANKISNQDMNLRLLFYNSAFILALSFILDNRFCYLLYFQLQLVTLFYY